jgi:diacylglycerol kinase family enzyme
MTGLETKKISSFEIQSDTPLAVHSDGEHLGVEIQNLSVKIVKGAIDVVTGLSH